MNRAASQFAHHASFAADTLLHGKWRVHILCAMRSGPMRLGQLARTIPRASKKVLTQNLRDLEAAGIIMRTDFSDVVLHIEYELKEDIRDSVLGLLDHLAEWGDAYLKDGNGNVTAEEQGEGPGGGT
jgi:DNA-binding HxlR family transcriptional regulator